MARRLAVVFPHVLLGGGEVATMEVGERLVAAFEVTALALDPGDGGDPSGAPTIREELAARFPRSSLLSRRWQLRAALAGFDAVLWYGLNGAIPRALAGPARRPVSLRVVHTERPEEIGFDRRWRGVTDAVICVSPAMARRLPGAVFVPNPVSPSRLAGEPQAFFPPGRRTLGFVGRLAPMKNVPWLIDQMAALGANLLLQAIDTELLTVAELRRRAAERGVAERVRFLPPARTVGTLLRSVDALVLPSSHEGFPLVVLEAGWLAVPVIATRVGALPELFGEEILWLESAGGEPDPASFRTAVAAIDPARGESLRHRVTALADPEVVAARHREEIERLLERRAQGSAATASSASGPL
jgi:glycosyltransferase involved in cell wall biosynthesis